MRNKEVDVLIDFIECELNFDSICDKLNETDYCEKHCTGENLGECVREYARVVAKERD
jgi:hypothetical protein